MELEHAIAQIHRSLADNEDIHKANNTWTQADFPAKAPGLEWAEYFRGTGLSQQKSFIVWQPEAFTGESALVASTPLDTWKDWLAFHLIEEYGGVLPKPFAEERFAFFGKALSARSSSGRGGSGASFWSMVCWATWSAKSMRSVIFHPKRRLRQKPWWPT